MSRIGRVQLCDLHQVAHYQTPMCTWNAAVVASCLKLGLILLDLKLNPSIEMTSHTHQPREPYEQFLDITIDKTRNLFEVFIKNTL